MSNVLGLVHIVKVKLYRNVENELCCHFCELLTVAAERH